MDPLMIWFVVFSLVTLLLQTLSTIAWARSTSRDWKVGSSGKDLKSAAEGDRHACPGHLVDRSDHPSAQLELPKSEGPLSEIDQPVPSKEARVSASDLRWQWLSYTKVKQSGGKITWKEIKGKNDAHDQADDPFKVHYDFTSDPDNCFDQVKVVLANSPLIGILRMFLPYHGDLKSLTEPNVRGRELYLVLDSLKNYAFGACAMSPPRHVRSDELPANGLKLANRENHSMEMREIGSAKETAKETAKIAHPALGGLYVKHLVRFLEEEYEDTLRRSSRMRQEERVSWDMLWVFLVRGTEVRHYCPISGELLYAKVKAASYHRSLSSPSSSLNNRRNFFRVELRVYDFNGTGYSFYTIPREIDEFHEEQGFLQLPVCPIEFFEDPSAVKKRFLVDGGTFSYLSIQKPNRLMTYEGSMYSIKEKAPKYRYGDWQIAGPLGEPPGGPSEGRVHKQKADGRVMIDLWSFAAMNPDYPMENARPPSKSRRAYEGSGNRTHPDDTSTDTFIFAPAIVYGFSFARKEWGCFAVSRLTEVTFDRAAFHKLVMEKKLKSLLKDLVGQYISSDRDPDHEESSEQPDPIAGKGQGCIVLCHGPPGTGKTLTAESIAESMDCPLWALSVAELGTDAEKLETTLMKVLDIAATWKAVLLLDEADVYLERRTVKGNVVRNAMTGVFLRQLEYYSGILFLTTNRLGTIDDAIKSRISLFLQYQQLGSADSASLWWNALTRVSMRGISEEFCQKLAERPLNGRQIRNIARTAQMWAKAKRERLGARHVQILVETLADSLTALDGNPQAALDEDSEKKSDGDSETEL